MSTAAPTPRKPRTVVRLLDRVTREINLSVRSQSQKAVHDLRVAIRRLHQGLAILKHQGASHEIKRLRKRLDSLLTAAGLVRDCDIALKLVDKYEHPSVPSLQNELKARRREHAAALRRVLRNWVSRRESAKWRVVLRAIEEEGPEHLEHFAIHLLPRMAKTFFRKGDRAASPQASAADIHHFRIEAKRVRYTLELVERLYGASAKQWLEGMKDLQKLLGDLNDCRVVRTLLDDYKGAGAISAALKKRQRKKTHLFRDLWKDRFSRSADVHHWIASLRHPPRKPMARAASAQSPARIAATS